MGCYCGKPIKQKEKDTQKSIDQSQTQYKNEKIEQDQQQVQIENFFDLPDIQKHLKNQKSIGSYQAKLLRKQTFEENGILKTIKVEEDIIIPDNLSEYMTNRNIENVEVSCELKISMIGHNTNSKKTKGNQYLQMLDLNNYDTIDIENFKNAKIPLSQIDFKTLKYSKQFDQFRQYHYFKQKEQKAILTQDEAQSDLIAQNMLNRIEENGYDLNKCRQEIALLALKNYYKNQGISLTFKPSQQQQQLKDQDNDQLNRTMVSTVQQQIEEQLDDYDEIQKHLSQTGFELQTYYQIRLENDYESWYYYKAENNKRDFAQFFKSEILKQYKNLKEDDINILNIQRGSIIVDFTTSQQIRSIQIGKQKFDEIPVKYIVSELQINEKYFNPEYDMYWDDRDEVHYRGNINGEDQQYHLPIGYIGLGLDVLNSVYPDDGWLNSDTSDDTWIVLFHSTKPECVNNILQEGFIAGNRQYFSESDCRFGRGQVGTGVYFSNKINRCEDFGGPIEVGEKQYSLIFQCRVNPKTIKSPKGEPEYYVCNDPKDARPYRILIKEYQQQS